MQGVTVRRALGALASVVVLTGTVFASGAGAGPVCSTDGSNAPDARYRIDGGPWTGGGAYADALADAGFTSETVTFEVQWRNRTDAAKTIRVHGYADVFPDTRVRVFVNGVRVTDRIDGAEDKGLTFKDVAPTKRTDVVEIRITADTGGFGQQALIATFKSVSPPQCDAVFAFVNGF